MNNARVVATLGCSYSTARNRLMNDLLYNMLVELGRDFCFQCGDKLSADDCTIEHKTPWLHDDNAVDLFYDLDNIAFSHHTCNSKARRSTTEVPHGGGVSGKKGCKCELCVARKAQYQLDWKAANKLYSILEG